MISYFDMDWNLVLGHLAHMAVAYLLAVPVAWNRERAARSAGLRTFPLVAMAACGYMLTGLAFLDGSESYSRVIYGIITGIGFVGGGAILKSRGTVRGTATAASIWSTGAMGIAVAVGRLEIAMVLSLMNFITFQVFGWVKDEAMEQESRKANTSGKEKE